MKSNQKEIYTYTINLNKLFERIITPYREKLSKVYEIRQNIHEAIYELITQVERLQVPFDTPQSQAAAIYLKAIGTQVPVTISYVRDIFFLKYIIL